ncbi:MAG: phage holin family protein [Acidimicrobiales bacterium]
MPAAVVWAGRCRKRVRTQRPNPASGRRGHRIGTGRCRSMRSWLSAAQLAQDSRWPPASRSCCLRRSPAEKARRTGRQVRVLISKEVELAKLEARDEISKASKAGALLAATGVAAFLGLLLLSFAVAWGLAAVIPTGLAFLAVGVVYLGVAGLLFGRGREQLAEVSPAPEQTMATLKEDVQVAKAALSRGAGSSTPASGRWS